MLSFTLPLPGTGGGASSSSPGSIAKAPRSALKRTPPGRGAHSAPRRVQSAPNVANNDYDADESDSEDLSSEYHHVVLQLLDLMYTLHTRAGQVTTLNFDA